MKILMLGGTRFFGRLILDRLRRDHHELVVVSRKVAGHCDPPCRQVVGERDSAETLAAVKRLGPYDAVVDNIAYHPGQISALLPAIAQRSKRPFYILTSTSAVYLDNYLDGPVSEDEVASPGRPLSRLFPGNMRQYALGKIDCERYVQSLDMPYLILRLPFVSGPDDFAGRLAYFLHRLESGEVMVPHWAATLQQLFSRDLAMVYAEAIARQDHLQGMAVNVAPPAISIERYLELAASAAGCDYAVTRLADDEWERIAAGFPYIYNQVMRTDRYKDFFSSVLTPMETFLPETIRWYLGHPEQWRAKYQPLEWERGSFNEVAGFAPAQR